jgi:hypothetical protein
MEVVDFSYPYYRSSRLKLMENGENDKLYRKWFGTDPKQGH